MFHSQTVELSAAFVAVAFGAGVYRRIVGHIVAIEKRAVIDRTLRLVP